MRATRIGVMVSTGLLGLLGLAACGPAADNTVSVPDTLSAEGQALVALGMDPLDLAATETADANTERATPTEGDGSPSATGATAGQGPGIAPDVRNRHRARMLLRRGVLHGEVVVRTKQGDKTIAVQRGTVAAVSDTGCTVKSPDGFTQTWTFGDRLRVARNRTRAGRDAITVNAKVGVAGVKTEGGRVASLVVIAPR